MMINQDLEWTPRTGTIFFKLRRISLPGNHENSKKMKNCLDTGLISPRARKWTPITVVSPNHKLSFYKARDTFKIYYRSK